MEQRNYSVNEVETRQDRQNGENQEPREMEDVQTSLVANCLQQIFTLLSLQQKWLTFNMSSQKQGKLHVEELEVLQRYLQGLVQSLAANPDHLEAHMARLQRICMSLAITDGGVWQDSQQLMDKVMELRNQMKDLLTARGTITSPPLQNMQVMQCNIDHAITVNYLLVRHLFLVNQLTQKEWANKVRQGHNEENMLTHRQPYALQQWQQDATSDDLSVSSEDQGLDPTSLKLKKVTHALKCLLCDYNKVVDILKGQSVTFEHYFSSATYRAVKILLDLFCPNPFEAMGAFGGDFPGGNTKDNQSSRASSTCSTETSPLETPVKAMWKGLAHHKIQEKSKTSDTVPAETIENSLNLSHPFHVKPNSSQSSRTSVLKEGPDSNQSLVTQLRHASIWYQWLQNENTETKFILSETQEELASCQKKMIKSQEDYNALSEQNEKMKLHLQNAQRHSEALQTKLKELHQQTESMIPVPDMSAEEKQKAFYSALSKLLNDHFGGELINLPSGDSGSLFPGERKDQVTIFQNPVYNIMNMILEIRADDEMVIAWKQKNAFFRIVIASLVHCCISLTCKQVLLKTEKKETENSNALLKNLLTKTNTQIQILEKCVALTRDQMKQTNMGFTENVSNLSLQLVVAQTQRNELQTKLEATRKQLSDTKVTLDQVKHLLAELQRENTILQAEHCLAQGNVEHHLALSSQQEAADRELAKLKENVTNFQAILETSLLVLLDCIQEAVGIKLDEGTVGAIESLVVHWLTIIRQVKHLEDTQCGRIKEELFATTSRLNGKIKICTENFKFIRLQKEGIQSALSQGGPDKEQPRDAPILPAVPAQTLESLEITISTLTKDVTKYQKEVHDLKSKDQESLTLIEQLKKRNEMLEEEVMKKRVMGFIEEDTNNNTEPSSCPTCKDKWEGCDFACQVEILTETPLTKEDVEEGEKSITKSDDEGRLPGLSMFRRSSDASTLTDDSGIDYKEEAVVQNESPTSVITRFNNLNKKVRKLQKRLKENEEYQKKLVEKQLALKRTLLSKEEERSLKFGYKLLCDVLLQDISYVNLLKETRELVGENLEHDPDETVNKAKTSKNPAVSEKFQEGKKCLERESTLEETIDDALGSLDKAVVEYMKSAFCSGQDKNPDTIGNSCHDDDNASLDPSVGNNKTAISEEKAESFTEEGASNLSKAEPEIAAVSTCFSDMDTLGVSLIKLVKDMSSVLLVAWKNITKVLLDGLVSIQNSVPQQLGEIKCHLMEKTPCEQNSEEEQLPENHHEIKNTNKEGENLVSVEAKRLDNNIGNLDDLSPVECSISEKMTAVKQFMIQMSMKCSSALEAMQNLFGRAKDEIADKYAQVLSVKREHCMVQTKLTFSDIVKAELDEQAMGEQISHLCQDLEQLQINNCTLKTKNTYTQTKKQCTEVKFTQTDKDHADNKLTQTDYECISVIHKLEEKIISLKKKVQETQQQLQESKKENQDSKTEITQLTRKLNEFDPELRTSESKMKLQKKVYHLQEKLEEAETENERLNSSLAAARFRLITVDGEIRKQEEETKKEVELREKLKEEVDSLKIKLIEKDSDVAKAKANLEIKDIRMQQINKERVQGTDYIKFLTDHVFALERERDEALSKLDSYNIRRVALTSWEHEFSTDIPNNADSSLPCTSNTNVDVTNRKMGVRKKEPILKIEMLKRSACKQPDLVTKTGTVGASNDQADLNSTDKEHIIYIDTEEPVSELHARFSQPSMTSDVCVDMVDCGIQARPQPWHHATKGLQVNIEKKCRIASTQTVMKQFKSRSTEMTCKKYKEIASQTYIKTAPKAVQALMMCPTCDMGTQHTAEDEMALDEVAEKRACRSLTKLYEEVSCELAELLKSICLPVYWTESAFSHNEDALKSMQAGFAYFELSAKDEEAEDDSSTLTSDSEDSYQYGSSLVDKFKKKLQVFRWMVYMLMEDRMVLAVDSLMEMVSNIKKEVPGVTDFIIKMARQHLQAWQNQDGQAKADAGQAEADALDDQHHDEGQYEGGGNETKVFWKQKAVTLISVHATQLFTGFTSLKDTELVTMLQDVIRSGGEM